MAVHCLSVSSQKKSFWVWDSQQQQQQQLQQHLLSHNLGKKKFFFLFFSKKHENEREREIQVGEERFCLHVNWKGNHRDRPAEVAAKRTEKVGGGGERGESYRERKRSIFTVYSTRECAWERERELSLTLLLAVTWFFWCTTCVVYSISPSASLPLPTWFLSNPQFFLAPTHPLSPPFPPLSFWAWL